MIDTIHRTRLVRLFLTVVLQAALIQSTNISDIDGGNSSVAPVSVDITCNGFLGDILNQQFFNIQCH